MNFSRDPSDLPSGSQGEAASLTGIKLRRSDRSARAKAGDLTQKLRAIDTPATAAAQAAPAPATPAAAVAQPQRPAISPAPPAVAAPQRPAAPPTIVVTRVATPTAPNVPPAATPIARVATPIAPIARDTTVLPPAPRPAPSPSAPTPIPPAAPVTPVAPRLPSVPAARDTIPQAPALPVRSASTPSVAPPARPSAAPTAPVAPIAPRAPVTPGPRETTPQTPALPVMPPATPRIFGSRRPAASDAPIAPRGPSTPAAAAAPTHAPASPVYAAFQDERALRHYWEQLRGRGDLPPAASLDTGRVAASWSNTLLVSFGDSGMPQIVRLGRHTDDVEYTSMVTEWILECSRHVARARRPTEKEERFPGERRHRSYHMLLLPFVSTSGQSDHVLCHMTCID